MEKTITETFGKYLVTLELFEEDGEQRSSCIIEDTYSGASSSLEKAWHEETLGEDAEEQRISTATVAGLANWAESNGY